MFKILSVISILFLVPYYAHTQSFYAARRERSLILVGGIGTSSYYGELTNPKDYLHVKPGLNVGLQYYLSNRISMRLAADWFQLKGDDSEAPLETARQPRNLSFKSDNIEINMTGHVSLLPQGKRFYQRPPLNLYAFGGVGLLYFNPTTEYNGTKYALQPLQTELVKYSRFAFVIPFGIGAKFKFGPYFNLSIEGGYRKTFTDYLDDVSTTHKGAAAFTNPISAALSDRRPEVGVSPVEPGYIRGNPKTMDGYFLFGAKIEYYLPTDFIFGGGPNGQGKLYNKKRSAYRRYNKKGGLKRRRR